jgi:phage terminase large subunit-like protein
VAGDFAQEGYNVQQICYDPYQLESLMQRLRHDRVAWCEPFSQQQDRLKADRMLYDLIVQRRLHHGEDPRGAVKPLREHVLNSNAKLEKDQDSKLRIIKKSSDRKIDLTVATSMGAYRCLYLMLS